MAHNQISSRLTSGNPLKTSVKVAMELVGYQIMPVRGAHRNNDEKRREYCKLCPKGHQSRIGNFCAICKKAVCKEHFSILCDSCMSVENVPIYNEDEQTSD